MDHEKDNKKVKIKRKKKLLGLLALIFVVIIGAGFLGYDAAAIFRLFLVLLIILALLNAMSRDKTIE